MRLSELAGLNDPDVDTVSDQVKLRGKGKKERLVPGRGGTPRWRCGSICRSATACWPDCERDPALFVNMRGKRITPRAFSSP